MTTNLFSNLDREWAALSRSSAARAAFARWSESDDELRDLHDLAGVVARLQDRSLGAERDLVFGALVRRSAADQLAARCVLQGVMPGLKSIARDNQCWLGRDEAAADVVAVAWERIRLYPVTRRPRSIATNLVLDTRQALMRERQRRQQVVLKSIEVPNDYGFGPVSRIDELIRLVHEAVRLGHLERDGARLIMLTRVAGVPLRDIAAATNCKVQTVRRQRLRAEARLRRAAAA